MNKTVCFGEILLRFSPLQNEESFEQQTMPFFVGGAELNVANALAKWQMPVAYCTAMPEGFLSENIKQYLASKQIDVSSIHQSGTRMGIYYLQQGTDVKNAGVVFDRENSSFACLQVGMINWREIFKGASWFHFSAIAASLTQNATDVCIEALEVAKELGLTISIDLNYRNKLWQYKKPTETIPQLVAYCDVVMGNLWAANKLLGTEIFLEDEINASQIEYISAAQKSIESIKSQYPNVKTVAYTFRFDTRYWAVLHKVNELYISKTREIGNVIDKVGSGDCFMAGLIYGISSNHNSQEIIDFSTTAAVGKLYEKGDCTNQTVDEIRERIKNDER
jgi:2-dehydro-3-deoxygluconokinase